MKTAWIGLLIVGFAPLSPLAKCNYLTPLPETMPADSFPDRGSTATLSIITEPPGSDVYVDKEFLGTTPILNKEWHSGFQQIYISEKTGGRLGRDIPLCQDTVKIWPDQNLELKINTVMPFGNVNIKTGIGGCDISLDGNYFNRTEGEVTLVRRLPAGTHEVSVSCKNGKRSTLVQVEGDKTADVDLSAKSKKKK